MTTADPRWHHVPLPPIAGPVEGLTAPAGDRFYVVAADGVTRVTFGPPPAAEVIAIRGELKDVYDPAEGWVFAGGHWHMVHGEADAPTDAEQPDDRPTLSSDEAELCVPDTAPHPAAGPFRTAEGGWGWAGESEGGEWLAVGRADGVQLFRRADR